VAHFALSPRPITLAALDLAPRAMWLMLIGVVLLAGAWAAPVPELAIVLIVPAMVFVILAVLVKALSLRHRRAEGSSTTPSPSSSPNDAAPSLTADRDGVIGYVNASGRAQFGEAGRRDAAHVCSARCSPRRARCSTGFRTRRSRWGRRARTWCLKQGHMRLSVHRVGQGGFLWRLEDIGPTPMRAGRANTFRCR
jgi:two-component system cell cycle sensor histidine kinase/response regulator CckA